MPKAKAPYGDASVPRSCGDYFATYKSCDMDYLVDVEDEIGVNHPQYQKFERCWAVMRHSVEGEDAIRENAIEMEYLQIPAGISSKARSGNRYKSSYDNTAEYHYVNRAHYIEIVPRILDEVEGRIFSKPYTINSPEKLELNFLDSDGLTFDQYVRWCVREVFSVSRFGVLVDWDEENQSPIIKRYVAESICNWGVDRRGQLNLVVLEDEVKEEGQIFSHNTIKRRISFTVENSADGPVVVQRTWLQDETSKNSPSGEVVFFESEKPTVLQRNGLALSKIPFIFFGGVKPTPPMLKPLAAAALDFFDAHASYRNAMWWATNEQPYINFKDKEASGFMNSSGKPHTAEDGEITIAFGSSSPILLINAEMGFAHVSGTGLDHARRRLTDSKAEMTGMGARSFNAQTASNIKVQTERMQNRAESSVIGSHAQAISIGIKQSLELAAEWAKISGNISFELNQDYTDDFDIKLIGQLIDARDSMLLSDERIFEYLKTTTKLIPSHMTYDDLVKEINKSGLNTDSFDDVNDDDIDDEDFGDDLFNQGQDSISQAQLSIVDSMES